MFKRMVWMRSGRGKRAFSDVCGGYCLPDEQSARAHNIIINNKSNKSSGRKNRSFTVARTSLVRVNTRHGDDARVVCLYLLPSNEIFHDSFRIFFTSDDNKTRRRDTTGVRLRPRRGRYRRTAQRPEGTNGRRSGAADRHMTNRRGSGGEIVGRITCVRDFQRIARFVEGHSLDGWRTTRLRSYPSDFQS